jgi:HCOMODA/2-hydroxy-3-carboxy-muconic semialdehyde decarboxylase
MSAIVFHWHRLYPFVIAGLDPAIHPFRKTFFAKQMDARVKPGHDVERVATSGRGKSMNYSIRCAAGAWLRAALVAATLLPTLAAGVAAQDLKAQIDDLVAANRILYKQGVVDGFGHVSVRHPTNPDRFLMAASLAPGRVTKDDIMEFDLEGKPIDQRNRTIYSERFIHSEIYKARKDVNAVLHSHSPTVVPFSVSQIPMRPILNSAGFLAPNVPVFEMRKVPGPRRGLLITDGALGKALAETLGDRPVALMRGHGNVVVGANVQRVVARAIYTEVNARLLWQAVTLGGPIIYIDEDEAKAGEVNRDRGEAGHGTDRIWQMWVEEAFGTADTKR